MYPRVRTGCCVVPKKEVVINLINLCGELAMFAQCTGQKLNEVSSILNCLTPFFVGSILCGETTGPRQGLGEML